MKAKKSFIMLGLVAGLTFNAHAQSVAPSTTLCGYITTGAKGDMSIKDAKGYWDLTDDTSLELQKVQDSYACGCVTGTVDARHMAVTKISKVTPKDMGVCKADKKLN